MSNIIDSILLSGTVYTLQGSGGGTVSSAITSGDTNAVAGGAVYDKFDEVEQVTARALNDLDEKKSSTVELTQEEYDALTTKDPNTYYVITDATPIDVSTFVTSGQMTSAITQATSGKVDSSSVVSSVTSASTDSEIPTAKAVWEAASGGGSTYTAGRGISIANDTISFSLPISAGTGTNSIICNRSDNKARGSYSFAGGQASSATSYWSFAYGASCKSEYGAWAGGFQCQANGSYSFAIGERTKTSNDGECTVGRYNVTNSGTMFSVGNGTADNARHNAFEIRQNGDIYLSSGGTDIKLQDYLGGGSITVDTALDSGSTNPVENRVIYNKIDEVEQVTAAALNNINDRLSEDEEVTAARLNALNDAFGGLKLMKISQTDYNNLQVKDQNTLYIIVN